MDLSTLREVCRTYTATEYFLEPIPERKAKMARESLKVPGSAQIVALIDFTLFGIADDALVIADSGLYWKNMTSGPQRLSWAQLRQREIREKKTFLSKAIDFGNGLEMELSGAASLVEKDNHLVANLLNELKALPEFSAVSSSDAELGGSADAALPEEGEAGSEDKANGQTNARDICRRYTAPHLFTEPIPQDTENDARTRLQVAGTESILAVIDATLSARSGKRVIAITNQGLYWRNPIDEMRGKAPQKLTWAQVRECSMSEKEVGRSKTIVFGDGLEMELIGAQSLVNRDNHIVIDMLKELMVLPDEAFAVRKVAKRAVRASFGLVECEFCKGKVKPEVTYCKHCGIKLRG